MKLTRLIVAAALMAALGGLVWWSNKSEVAKEAKPPADTTPKILSLKEGDIRQLEIDHKDGEQTVIKKDASNQWQIVSPKQVATDQGSVSAVSTAVSSISSDRVVDPNATDVASYGLMPADLTVKVGTADGKTTTLLVGDEAPSGSVYAKLEGDPRLFTMSKSVKDSLNKSTKDLRDKRLLTFDSNTVTRVELNIAGQPQIEFGRSGPNQWQILKPKVLRADSTQLEDFMSRLHEAEMDPMLSDEDEKKYAMAYASAPSAATVTITSSSGEQKLEVHKSKDDYYAKSSVVDGVYKLTAADLTSFFTKKLDDFRNKKIFDFGFNDPNRIDIKDGAKTVSVEKMGDNWVSGGKTMDNTSVQSLIDRLRDLSASKFADTGFGTPAIDLTVVSDSGKRTEKVQIAPSGKDFIAKRENDPTLYQLDASAVQDLRTSAGDVREQPPQTQTKKK